MSILVELTKELQSICTLAGSKTVTDGEDAKRLDELTDFAKVLALVLTAYRSAIIMNQNNANPIVPPPDKLQ